MTSLLGEVSYLNSYKSVLFRISKTHVKRFTKRQSCPTQSVLSTELPANFTLVFCQNNDYEYQAWFSLENCGTESATNVFFCFAGGPVMICNFAVID